MIRSLFAQSRVGLAGVALLAMAALGPLGVGTSVGAVRPAAAAAQDDPVALAVGLRALNDFAAASATALAARRPRRRPDRLYGVRRRVGRDRGRRTRAIAR